MRNAAEGVLSPADRASFASRVSLAIALMAPAPAR